MISNRSKQIISISSGLDEVLQTETVELESLRKMTFIVRSSLLSLFFTAQLLW